MAIETREPDEHREGLTARSTYKTLDEQEGKLSEAEQRFERRRRTVGLFLGPVVFAIMLLIPFDLDGNQHRLAAILAFVIVWWLTEAVPIPVTALLGVVLCALLEATPPPPEGFIGSFIIAQAHAGAAGIAAARWCTACTAGSPSGCSRCARSAARRSGSSWPSG